MSKRIFVASVSTAVSGIDIESKEVEDYEGCVIGVIVGREDVEEFD